MLFNSGNLLKFLEQYSIEVGRNIELSKISYFKSGGIISYLISPNSIDILSKLITFLNNEKMIFRILGASTNCIFLDDTNIDICISLKNLKKINFDSNNMEVYVESGAMVPKLVRKLKNFSIANFEGLEGIPASLGGAIFMNAGSCGYTISDNIKEVIIMNVDGSLHTLTKSDCHFRHRESIFHNKLKHKIIIGAIFKVKYGNKKKIEKKIFYYRNHRQKILEYDYPNVGSVFVVADIYQDIARNSFMYKVILFFIRVFVHRIVRAKNNAILNKVTAIFFNIHNYKDVVSKCTMNVVINKRLGTDKVIEYINKMHTLLGNQIKKEIEIV